MGFLTYDVNRFTPQQLVALPLILFVASLVILGYNVATIGMPVQPGIEFAGGTGVTIFTTDTKAQIESYFAAVLVRSPSKTFTILAGSQFHRAEGARAQVKFLAFLISP